MKELLDVYRSQFKVSLATELQYRLEVLIWLFGSTLEPVVYLVVWATVANANGGSVGGYTASGFAAYFIVMMLVNHVTFTWIMFEFETRIREGAFSPKLLRPIHPIHADVADNLTYKLVGLVALVPVAIALTVAFGATYPLTLGRILAFGPVIFLAFVLRFTVEWTLSLAAFWTTRVGAINQMYNLAVIFLAGQMAPLSLFPAPVQTLAGILPYRWMVAFPVELILGKVDRSGIWLGLAMQVVWVVASLVLLNVVWRFAARRYSAVGA